VGIYNRATQQKKKEKEKEACTKSKAGKKRN
jgi:hypothetical protein